MKKIYLIDDNSKNQRVSYGASFVDDGLYDDVLCHIEKVNKGSDLTELSEAVCIMVHESLEDYIDGQFIETSHGAEARIVKFAEDNKVPYVCFSDGLSQTGEFDESNNIVKIKKSEFYLHLEDFVENYRINKSIELKILAYGRNFNKNVLEKLIKSLFLKFSTKQCDEQLKISDVMPKKNEGNYNKEPEYLKEIITRAQPAIGVSYDDILNSIEDNGITVGEFKEKINKIFNSVIKYGKNNYIWE